MDDSIDEENNIHWLDLLLFVVFFELSVKEFSECIEICNFLINLALLIFDKEVDKCSIPELICHAVLHVVHLELSFKLVIDHFLELITILEIDQSIMEDSENLVAPQFDDLLLRLIVVLVRKEKSLEDLRDVTHVVDVMRFLRSGEEIVHALVEDVDRGNCKGVLQLLDIVTELSELSLEDGLVDLAHLLLTWVSEVDQMEFGDKTRGDMGSSTTGLAHGGD